MSGAQNASEATNPKLEAPAALWIVPEGHWGPSPLPMDFDSTFDFFFIQTFHHGIP